METLIFDIDGTLTEIWPLERAILCNLNLTVMPTELDTLYQSGIRDLYVLYKKIATPYISKSEFRKSYDDMCQQLWSKGALPQLTAYTLVEFIKQYANRYQFIYATGGGEVETKYVLNSLGIGQYFNINDSISRNTCKFKKSTGIPLRKILIKYPNSILITDSQSDLSGARKIGMRTLLIN
jgi:phosphoglycolate phosphatase-like HAD superfamily hydrolase